MMFVISCCSAHINYSNSIGHWFIHIIIRRSRLRFCGTSPTVSMVLAMPFRNSFYLCFFEQYVLWLKIIQNANTSNLQICVCKTIFMHEPNNLKQLFREGFHKLHSVTLRIYEKGSQRDITLMFILLYQIIERLPH